jgi:NADPH-dependent glutamate synthase beta subunit-like oxidoreductase
MLPGSFRPWPATRVPARIRPAIYRYRSPRTSEPDVWAAGDVVRGLNQISVAIGEAAIAATAITTVWPAGIRDRVLQTERPWSDRRQFFVGTF